MAGVWLLWAVNGIAKVIHRVVQLVINKVESAQTVRCPAVTAATRVRFRASDCDICGERSATVTAFCEFVCVRVSASYTV